jgi:hypothetical protein
MGQSITNNNITTIATVATVLLILSLTFIAAISFVVPNISSGNALLLIT